MIITTNKHRLIHVINNKGERKIIQYRDPLKEKSILNENNNDEFFIDIDWYLNNGYTRFEDAIKDIEGDYYGQII